MASASFESAYLEFLESRFDKPEPLRIVKLGRAFGGYDGPCSPTPGQVIVAEGKSSRCVNTYGSPPESVSTTLTIQKKRRDRGSAFDSSYDSESSSLVSPRTDRIISSRFASAGAFLKSELCRGSSESCASDTSFTWEPLQVPRRDLSKSKRKLVRAFDSVRSKSMNFLMSNSSENLRSRSDRKILESSIPRYSLESNIDVNNPRTLYPEMTVTPEYDTISSRGEISFWVAIQVVAAFRGPSQVSSCYTAHPSLYDVDIKLSPGKDSTIEEIHLPCRNPCVLRFGETKMVIAKVRLRNIRKAKSHVRQSSQDLLEELEEELGSTSAEYLRVQISYKDSPFPATIPLIPGVSDYSISSVIDARLVIPRQYNASTAISDRILILIEENFNQIVARDLIAKYNGCQSGQQSTIEGRGRLEVIKGPWNSSTDTVIPMPESTSESSVRLESRPISPSSPLESVSPIVHGESDFDSDSRTPTAVEIDPARKIWSELRRSSRGFKEGRDSHPEEYSEEQSIIKEKALRNRRSIGADTLRSMAGPSTQMGLGTGGRGVWSWGAPWW